MTATRFSLGVAIGLWAMGSVAAQTPLYRSKPLPPPPGEARQVVQPVSASQVLTGEAPPPGGSLPAGSVESPWSGATQAGAFDGAIGGNGPVSYELLGYNGPSFPVLGGVLNNRLNVGWMVGVDSRTLYFNQSHDAAWVLILGYSYIFNKGQDELDNAIDVATPRNRTTVDGTGNLVTSRDPVDGLAKYTVNLFHRETVNFGFGHDWWLNGPATVGSESCSNWRFGVETGGRWGTGHVILIPVDNRETHLRRAGIHHGFYLGTSLSWERPFGNTILYAGLRAQWTYNWMNYVLPQDGDLQDVNILMTMGIRF